jgi:hypothetical protein
VLQVVRSWVLFLVGLLGIHIDLILLLRVCSASNRKEYHEYLLGGKGGQCVELTTLPPSCADCLESLGTSKFEGIRGCSALSYICVIEIQGDLVAYCSQF